MNPAERLLHFIVLFTVFAGWAPAPALGKPAEIRVGSKKFTESVILGNVVAGLIENAGYSTRHRKELGGTRVLWDALVKGQIDVYPEYTGTIAEEILARQGVRSKTEIRTALSRSGIGMTESLGFNDNYAIGMRKETCRKFGIRRISDLKNRTGLTFGFSNEFMARADGWPGLRARYGLGHMDVRGLDHDLAYRGLAVGTIDATDLYTTDAEIAYYDLCVLDDDLGYFPVYEAVLLYRKDLQERAPRAVAALAGMEGKITESAMIRMNERAKIGKIPESDIAAGFLAERLSLNVRTKVPTVLGQVWQHTKEHLDGHRLVQRHLQGDLVGGGPVGDGAFPAVHPYDVRCSLLAWRGAARPCGALIESVRCTVERRVEDGLQLRLPRAHLVQRQEQALGGKHDVRAPPDGYRLVGVAVRDGQGHRAQELQDKANGPPIPVQREFRGYPRIRHPTPPSRSRAPSP